jgi:hypothetical protein
VMQFICTWNMCLCSVFAKNIPSFWSEKCRTVCFWCVFVTIPVCSSIGLEMTVNYWTPSMLFAVRCLALVLSSRGLGEIWQCMSRHPQTCIQLAQMYTLLFSMLRCVSFLNRCLPAVCWTVSTLCHPSLRFMVNCEQILSYYMSKALYKKLGLYARSITWIDLVTRVIIASSPCDLGFSQCCW